VFGSYSGTPVPEAVKTLPPRRSDASPTMLLRPDTPFPLKGRYPPRYRYLPHATPPIPFRDPPNPPLLLNTRSRPKTHRHHKNRKDNRFNRLYHKERQKIPPRRMHLSRQKRNRHQTLRRKKILPTLQTMQAGRVIAEILNFIDFATGNALKVTQRRP
jgi:hypothetical protein